MAAAAAAVAAAAAAFQNSDYGIACSAGRRASGRRALPGSQVHRAPSGPHRRPATATLAPAPAPCRRPAVAVHQPQRRQRLGYGDGKPDLPLTIVAM